MRLRRLKPMLLLKPANADTQTDAGVIAADATDTANAAAPDPSTLEEAFEQGRIAGLQEAILAIMSKNGPITDQMRRDVTDNVYHDSLINWIKSFR